MRTGLLFLVALLTVLPACDPGQESTFGARAPDLVTEWAGAVAGTDPGEPEAGKYAVALAVEPDGAVSGYACDGLGESTVLNGSEEGDRLLLESDDGEGRLLVNVSGDTAQGTLTVGDLEQELTLTTQRGVGGLYTVRLELAADEAELRISGSSVRGNTLSGNIGEDDEPPFTLAFRLTDGTERNVDLAGGSGQTEELTGFDTYRLAFTDDGWGRGNPALHAARLAPSTTSGVLLVRKSIFVPPASRPSG